MLGTECHTYLFCQKSEEMKAGLGMTLGRVKETLGGVGIESSGAGQQ